MKRIHSYLVALVLAVATIGPALLGSGAALAANVSVRPHISSVSVSFVPGESTKAVAIKFRPPCIVPGYDC